MQSAHPPVSAPVTLHELYGLARCVSCQQKARRCHVEQGAECCLQCAPDEPCTFSRTVLRTGSAKTFSWEELIGRSSPLPVNQSQQVGQALPEKKSLQRQPRSRVVTYNPPAIHSWAGPYQKGDINESFSDAEFRLSASPEFRTTINRDHENIERHLAAPTWTTESSAQSSDSLICPQEGCGYESRTKSDLMKHVARHNKEHVCDEPSCPRTEGFATLNDLERHQKSVHGTQPNHGQRHEYKCFGMKCVRHEKEWPRFDNFKQHLKRMHQDESIDMLIARSNEWYEKNKKPQPKPAGRLSSPSSKQATETAGRLAALSWDPGVRQPNKGRLDGHDLRARPSSTTTAQRPGTSLESGPSEIDFVMVDPLGEDEPPGKRQKRTYTEAERLKVAQVRAIGACWRCKILKENCSAGDLCDACQTASSQHDDRLACRRGSLLQVIPPLIDGFSKVFGHGTSVPVRQYETYVQAFAERYWSTIGHYETSAQAYVERNRSAIGISLLLYDPTRKYRAVDAEGGPGTTYWPNVIVPKILQICSRLVSPETNMIHSGMTCLREISAVEACLELKPLFLKSGLQSTFPKDYEEGRRLFFGFLEALEDLVRTKSVSTGHLPWKFLAISLLILVEHSIATSCARAQRSVPNIADDQVEQPDEAGATILALCRLALPKSAELEPALLRSEDPLIRELAGHLPFNKDGDFWGLLWMDLTRIDVDDVTADMAPLVRPGRNLRDTNLNVHERSPRQDTESSKDHGP